MGLALDEELRSGPAIANVTGDICSHEIALIEGKPWIVDTLLPCRYTIDDTDVGFIQRWRPPFIDRLADEARGHIMASP